MNFDIHACRIAVIGPGRAGHAIAAALRDAGVTVQGPLARGVPPTAPEILLLCVPDGEIVGAAAAHAGSRALLVGHCSGAGGLELLAPHAERFSMHPLMTLLGEGASLRGAAAAIDGSSDRSRAAAAALAHAAGMAPFELDPEDRAAYHAAASMASNFLLALEAAAERLARTAGLEREQLAPLVRASVENWARMGSGRALTGPIARGDEATVERQRDAVAQRTPELLGVWDELSACTRSLASSGAPAR